MEEPKRSMSREELYELVWSTPMQKQAETYGLSDRGLAKTCQRYLVPVPSRGYWARIDAGQTVKRTPLRAVENKALHTVHIGARPVSTRSPYLEQILETALREIEVENKRLRQPSADENVPLVHNIRQRFVHIAHIGYAETAPIKNKPRPANEKSSHIS